MGINENLLSTIDISDDATFSSIYKKYWKELFNAAYKRLKDIDQCQDIVQNVFISLWNRKDGAEIKDIAAYLHSAVKFQVFKYGVRTDTSEFLEAFENILISPISPESTLLEKEILALVKLWIEALPKKRREIFVLYYHEGLTTNEIANLLNVSRKTVQNQLNTATHALRGKLAHILSMVVVLSYISRQ